MKTKPLILTFTSAAVLFCALGAVPVSAQIPVPPLMPAYQPLSDQQLDNLLGPIALYPDPLLGEILSAATFPTQIVLADRYVAGGGDPSLIDQQPWDASVLAVSRYPAVLKYLDDNLAWTTELGEAFINQQQQVMESIQRLRLSAQNFGNLQSTPQQEVVNDDGCVEILPADADVIYVPVYLPEYVYDQSGYGLTFGLGWPMGPWLDCDFDWIHHNLCYWDHGHRRPAGWWHERPDQRQATLASQTTVWHAQSYHGFTSANRRDRGGNSQAFSPMAATTSTAPFTQARERQEQRPQQLQPRNQPAQQPNATIPSPQHAAPAFRPENGGAFTGSESTRDARTFSDRGQQSIEAAHPEPPPPRYEAPQPHYEAPPQPHYEAPQTHSEAAAPAPAPAPESGESHGSSRH